MFLFLRNVIKIWKELPHFGEEINPCYAAHPCLPVCGLGRLDYAMFHGRPLLFSGELVFISLAILNEQAIELRKLLTIQQGEEETQRVVIQFRGSRRVTCIFQMVLGVQGQQDNRTLWLTGGYRLGRSSHQLGLGQWLSSSFHA